jgi:signal transduction histidine kinase
MRFLFDRDSKIFFLIIVGITVISVFLPQVLFLSIIGKPSFALFILSVLLGICVIGIFVAYLRKQHKRIAEAEKSVNDFISGDMDARIDCNSEGDLFRFFHAVNTLTTSLNAGMAAEKKTKDFLKDTISDISHQLKTPLSALNIYNALIQDESVNNSAVMEFAVKSEKELDRIETLVQNLLKITRMDAGEIALKFKDENVENLLRSVVDSFETKAVIEHKEIELHGDSSAALYCDFDWLFEAISNIVKNAIDHTDKNGQISISWQATVAAVKIIVSDNGAGISPEDIHHIFKRFYRSKTSKDTQGIGLGLSLAKAIIEAHNGNITVESKLGNGSVFTLYFSNLTKL